MEKLTFGPVPSRRLGISLGINNIPYKHCSFSCIYCQIGRTGDYEYDRRVFYEPDVIINAVIESITRFGETKIDYATFVPDGEPTLDVNLGYEISEIKKRVKTKIAVITNSSLLYRKDVKDDLRDANLVSLKIDAISTKVFRLIDRPHPKLDHDRILKGIKEFTADFPGKIITETMLVKDVNDNEKELEQIAEFISNLNTDVIYIGIPTRPPAESWATPPGEESILKAYYIFSKYNDKNKIELLLGTEGPEFYNVSDDPIEGLLAIMSVHPMQIDYIEKYLEKWGLDTKQVLDKLLAEGKLIKLDYMNTNFYLRKIHS
ncbi:MAG: radical SAM protein [Promethearchaeota archaeon]